MGNLSSSIQPNYSSTTPESIKQEVKELEQTFTLQYTDYIKAEENLQKSFLFGNLYSLITTGHLLSTQVEKMKVASYETFEKLSVIANSVPALKSEIEIFQNSYKLLKDYLNKGIKLESFCNDLYGVVNEALKKTDDYSESKFMPWQQPSLEEQPKGELPKIRFALQMTQHLRNDFEEFLNNPPQDEESEAILESSEWKEINKDLDALLKSETPWIDTVLDEKTALLKAIRSSEGQILSIIEAEKLKELFLGSAYEPVLNEQITELTKNPSNETKDDRSAAVYNLCYFVEEAYENQVLRRTQEERNNDLILSKNLSNSLNKIIDKWKTLIPSSAIHPALQATTKALNTLSAISKTKTTQKTAYSWRTEMEKAGFKIDKLGVQGAMSTVYKATREIKGVKEVFLLKVFKDPISYEKWAKANTGERTARIDSPYFIKIHGAFENADGQIEAVVMDFVPEARELRDLIIEGKLNEKEKITHFWHLLQALKILEDNELVHRDIKLDNILIDKNEHLKLIDPGFQQNLSIGPPSIVGEYIGSPIYAAPEILMGQEHGIATNIYSAGVCAYLIFADKRKLLDLKDDDINPYLFIPPKTRFFVKEEFETKNPDLYQFISSMLVNNPSQRPSVDALITTFKAYAETRGVTYTDLTI